MPKAGKRGARREASPPGSVVTEPRDVTELMDTDIIKGGAADRIIDRAAPKTSALKQQK